MDSDFDSEADRDGGGRRALWGLAVALVAVAAAVGVYLAAGPEAGSDGAERASSGEERASDSAAFHAAPGPREVPAEVVTFATPAGDSASLADYRGQVVVLNLWGTWCPPCRREIPHLVELHEEIRDRGGTVVGLAVDSGSPGDILAFARDLGVNYPLWMTKTQRVVDHYQAIGFPTTLVIDGEGIIRKRYLGPQSKEALLAAVEPLLEG